VNPDPGPDPGFCWVKREEKYIERKFEIFVYLYEKLQIFFISDHFELQESSWPSEEHPDL
jgi:hypothetical protein